MAQPEDNSNTYPQQSRAGTPQAPPFSPVTPVMSHSTLLPPPPGSDSLLDSSSSASFIGPSASQPMPPQSQAPLLAPEPTPVPISESENPDAIVLRSALSILQIQRQQALRDIRELNELKKAAAQDPEAFSRDVASGRLKSATGDITHPPPASDGDDDGDGDEVGEQRGKEGDIEVDSGTARQAPQPKAGKFGKVPGPQNVIRMPPINWAKYHIVGEPLDKLHEEQRRRPSPGEPRRDGAAQGITGIQESSPEHFVAAPYRPFADRLEPSTTTAKAPNKRKHDQT